jgi:hypothetical protein
MEKIASVATHQTTRPESSWGNDVPESCTSTMSRMETSVRADRGDGSRRQDVQEFSNGQPRKPAPHWIKLKNPRVLVFFQFLELADIDQHGGDECQSDSEEIHSSNYD